VLGSASDRFRAAAVNQQRGGRGPDRPDDATGPMKKRHTEEQSAGFLRAGVALAVEPNTGRVRQCHAGTG